ncbi:hypothetical protein B0H12DRAFT_197994 [Mycena haematopus]|nr:hypothetical protein B0H12DRAFT_197994 [Mycena haematopus]
MQFVAMFPVILLRCQSVFCSWSVLVMIARWPGRGLRECNDSRQCNSGSDALAVCRKTRHGIRDSTGTLAGY